MFTSLRTVATPLNHEQFPEFQPLNSGVEGAVKCERNIWVTNKDGHSTWLSTAMKSVKCGHEENMATFYCPQHERDFTTHVRNNQASDNKKGYDLKAMTVEEEAEANKHQQTARKVLIGLGVFVGVGAIAGIAAGAAVAATPEPPRCTTDASQKVILKTKDCVNLKSVKLQDSQGFNTAWEMSEGTQHKVLKNACSATIASSNLSTLKGTTNHTLTVNTYCGEKKYGTTSPFQYDEHEGPVTLDLDCAKGEFTLSQSSPSCDVPSDSQGSCTGEDASYKVILNTENCVDLKAVTINDDGAGTLWEVDKQSDATKAVPSKCNLAVEHANKQHLSKTEFKPIAFTKNGDSLDNIVPTPETISFNHNSTGGYIKLDVNCVDKTFSLSQDGTCTIPEDSTSDCKTDPICTTDSSYTVVLDAQNCNNLAGVNINTMSGGVWFARSPNNKTPTIPSKCNSEVPQTSRKQLDGKTKFKPSARIGVGKSGKTIEPNTSDKTIDFTYDTKKGVIKFTVDCNTSTFTLTQSDSCDIPADSKENCPNV